MLLFSCFCLSHSVADSMTCLRSPSVRRSSTLGPMLGLFEAPGRYTYHAECEKHPLRVWFTPTASLLNCGWRGRRGALRPPAGCLARSLSDAAAALGREDTMNLDTSHGAVALMIGVNFLSAFNGMQQRASQLAIAVERLGFALHYVSLGTLQATSECAHADVAVVCHTPGDAMAQYDGFARWARAHRTIPKLAILGFTSLTVEVSRVVTRMPAAELDGWQAGGYDPAHVPKAHRCVTLLNAVLRDFPASATIIYTDDVHFQRVQHVLQLSGRMAALSPRQTRVLASARELELQTYSKAHHVLFVADADERAVLDALRGRNAASKLRQQRMPRTSVLPFSTHARPYTHVASAEHRLEGRMLFVGTCHPVAKASIGWFVQSILPLVVHDAPSSQLRVVGNGWQSAAASAPFAEWVERGALVILGPANASELEQEYQAARLFVAPVLNTTGVSTKIVHAMANGLPVLTTTMGTAGLQLSPPSEPCCSVSRPRCNGSAQAVPSLALSFSGIHPSRAILVADGAKAFATAAARALHDVTLWQDVSKRALSQMRSLTDSFQSAALAGALSAAHVEIPTRRGCLLVCVRCTTGPQRIALRRTVSRLVRSKVSVHVVLLPQAQGPVSELLVLGRLQTPGVFFYFGTPQEQWAALRTAAPEPPPSFAVIVADEESRAADTLNACTRMDAGAGAETLPIIQPHDIWAHLRQQPYAQQHHTRHPHPHQHDARTMRSTHARLDAPSPEDDPGPFGFTATL